MEQARDPVVRYGGPQQKSSWPSRAVQYGRRLPGRLRAPSSSLIGACRTGVRGLRSVCVLAIRVARGWKWGVAAALPLSPTFGLAEELSHVCMAGRSACWHGDRARVPPITRARALLFLCRARIAETRCEPLAVDSALKKERTVCMHVCMYVYTRGDGRTSSTRPGPRRRVWRRCAHSLCGHVSYGERRALFGPSRSLPACRISDQSPRARSHARQHARRVSARHVISVQKAALLGKARAADEASA